LLLLDTCEHVIEIAAVLTAPQAREALCRRAESSACRK
jgi:hypothetical protein